MQIFYIHGFNSYKGSSTPKKIERAIDGHVHELYYRSEKAFDDIMQDLTTQYLALSHGEPAIIAGTSMGGFFADQLCDLPGVYAVILINPVVDPCLELTQEMFLGMQENFITHETYLFTKETAMTYGDRRDMRSIPVRRFLLLAEHDELMDSSIALEYWGSCSRYVPIEGGHRLTDLGSVVRIILSLIPDDEDINERYAG